MSLCGGIENGGGPTAEQFDRHVIPYHEVNTCRQHCNMNVHVHAVCVFVQ